MDFLKSLFDGKALTYEELDTKVREKGYNVANIANGAYVGREKYDAKVNGLNQQVTDLKAQVTQRDEDLEKLKGTLASAQADAGKLNDAQSALTELQSKYESERAEWAAKQQKQAYEFKVRELAGKEKFSSASAKKAFIADAIAKNFQADGDKLLGYNEFLAQYKTDDPGAFAAEEKMIQQVTAPVGGKTGPGEKLSLSDLMRRKNENPNYKIEL